MKNLEQQRTNLLFGALILFVLAVLTVMIHNVFTAPYPGMTDFLSRWEGAYAYFREGISPYSDQVGLNIQQLYYGRPAVEGEDFMLFAYPMFTIYYIWPLVYTTYAWASAIWLVVLGMSLIGATLLAINLVNWSPGMGMRLALIFFAVLNYYAARGLLVGNFSHLVHFLHMLAIWGVVRHRDEVAGVAIALSAVKPQMGLLLVPLLLGYALVQGRWRVLAACAGTGLALFTLSTLAQPDWLAQWLDHLQRYPTYTTPNAPIYLVFTQFLQLPPQVGHLLQGGLVLHVLWAWYQVAVRGHTEGFLWVVAYTLVITHLIFPRTSTPHFVVFTLVLVYVLKQLPGWGRWAALGLLLVGPWMHFLNTVQGHQEHISLFVPMPFLTLFLLWAVRRRWGGAPATTP